MARCCAPPGRLPACPRRFWGEPGQSGIPDRGVPRPGGRRAGPGLSGRFTLEERSLLEAEVRKGGALAPLLALNELVLSRSQASRLIELEVEVNGELLTRYRCDGLIVSSPTGSTAYSLAAGGAIVSPDAEVLILTPICPHTLSIRPLVLNLASRVEMTVVSDRLTATVTADGQQQDELAPGDRVAVWRSRRTIRLVRLEGDSFFATLRHKFGWSGSNV